MAKRESLKKLNASALKIIATEHGIDVKNKKKEDLINEILTCQVPSSVLTPVIVQESIPIEGNVIGIPCHSENLPPFNQVNYSCPGISISFPSLSFTQRYEFLVSRPTTAGGTSKNFKGLDRAVKHFDAGDVHDIGVAQINASTLYIRASCKASMKKHRYQVYICISTSPRGESSLQYAYCQCPIGLAQACSHIGGLLFALSNAKIAESVKSCTSKPCQWNVPGGQVKPSGPLSTIRQRKPKLPHTMTGHGTTEYPENDPVTSFDPRHTKDRNFHLDQTLNHLRDLKDVFPNTGIYNTERRLTFSHFI